MALTMPAAYLISREWTGSPLRDLSWQDRAACREEGVDPDQFTPDRDDLNPSAMTAQAKRICARCPVKQPCLVWALERMERHGVLGATGRVQRERLFKIISDAERAAAQRSKTASAQEAA